MSDLKNDLFLRACKQLPVERTPIWVMRQAGRYLPEYRKVREKVDFITMCKTPELAAEVTLQPVDIIGVDAAIIFSDILVIPEAMGMPFEMHEGTGPLFLNPVRDSSDVDKLRPADPSRDLKYVLDAIELTKRELKGRVPLIGFSGSPWTLMAYMIEGRGSKNFSHLKRVVYDNPSLAHRLLDRIADSVADYLNAQMDAGADAVQIFDTWGGILSQDDFLTFSLKYIEKVISRIKREAKPVIVFTKGVHFSFRELAGCGADVLGLDWTVGIGKVKEITGSKVALQGNMDPTVLYAGHETIKNEALKILKSYGDGPGHIFNLGHGILPDIPPENLKVLVNFVKKESRKNSD